MRNLLKVIFSLTILVAFVACNTKSNPQNPADDSNKQIEQTKKDIDKIVEDAQKDADSIMDKLASGGQPGSVSLTGAFVVDDSTLDSRVKVSLLAGKSWRGQQAEVGADTLRLKTQLSAESVQELDKVKNDKSYYNFGCDLSNRNDLQDLEEKKLNPSDSSSVAVIKAKIILICDDTQLKSNVILVTADTVVFSNLNLSLVGAVEKMLSITTNELEVEGDNKINSKGKDGTSTLLQGPSVSIGSNKISGNGKIEISSEGASYKGEAK